jgi:transposase
VDLGKIINNVLGLHFEQRSRNFAGCQGKIDAKAYLKILRTELVPEAILVKETHGVQVNIMHDNAPSHASNAIKTFMRQCGQTFLDWPPYSPDLNPIENVWAWVKYKLYTDFPPAESEDELIDYIFEIWTQLDAEMCSRFCDNYYKRLEAVKKANGLQTNF